MEFITNEKVDAFWCGGGWQIIQENDWDAASTVVHLLGDPQVAQVANLERK